MYLEQFYIPKIAHSSYLLRGGKTVLSLIHVVMLMKQFVYFDFL